VRMTGERVVTAAGGHNPTWQRHVAAYRLIADMLPAGRVLDLGCGVGHSYRLLDRDTIGIDLDIVALTGQARPTARADMRRIPLRDGAVASLVSVQSVEHVPDPHRVLLEAARVIHRDGSAVFVTPNRLTLGRPDEIIDPWHYVEFDAAELSALARSAFGTVEIYGLRGSQRYLDVRGRELASLERVLAIDRWRLRRLAPRRFRQWAYSFSMRRMRGSEDPLAAAITEHDFTLDREGLDSCLDLVACCRGPLRP